MKIDVIAHTKAVQALATCRLAVAGDGDGGGLLEEARAWALAAVTGSDVPGTDLPEGHDETHPIGHYVLGLVNETLGVKLTRANPASQELHAQAASHFEAARTHYGRASSTIAEKYAGNATLAGLATEIGHRVQLLNESASYLHQATRKPFRGNHCSPGSFCRRRCVATVTRACGWP